MRCSELRVRGAGSRERGALGWPQAPVLAHHASRVIGVSRSLLVLLKRDSAADAALFLGRKYRSDR